MKLEKMFPRVEFQFKEYDYGRQTGIAWHKLGAPDPRWAIRILGTGPEAHARLAELAAPRVLETCYPYPRYPS